MIRSTSRSASATGSRRIDVMTPEARISLAAPERFQGLDRYEARRQVVAEFEAPACWSGWNSTVTPWGTATAATP